MFRDKQLVLFDLDGTLVDTVPDLTTAINVMQTGLGLPLRGEDEVRRWVGNGMDRLVKRALTGESDAEPEAELYERGRTIFMDAYAERPCEKSRFYPGVQALLDHLQQSGYKLACVTNKRARFTDTLLKILGIYDRFAIVLSGDTLPRRKPDPLPLLHAGETLGVIPANMLMIGDSLTDIRAAQAAGIDIVCVSYGYHQGLDLRAAGVERIVDCLEQLIDVFPPAVAA